RRSRHRWSGGRLFQRCPLRRRHDRLRCWSALAGAPAQMRLTGRKGACTMPIRLQTITAVLFLAAVAVPSHAQQIVVSKDNRTIAVTTSADAHADADTVTVQIGFLDYGADQDSAYALGSKTPNALRAALEAAGVPPDAIESESQSIAHVQQYGNQEWTPAEKAARQFQVQQ